MFFKTNIFSISFCIIFSALTFVFAVDEEASMAGFMFLDNPTAPRQIAMGNGGTALGGYCFVSFNPASFAINKTPYLSVFVSPRPFDYTIASIEGIYNINNIFFGAYIGNHFIDKIIPSDFIDGPQYDKIASYNGTIISLCAGFNKNNLGLGIALNGIQERIVAYAAYGISASFGITYKLLNDKLAFGVSALQFGTTTGFLEETKKFGYGAPLPRSGRLGSAYSDILFGIPYTIVADIVYRDVGRKVTSASQLFSRITVPVGLEVWPNKHIALRMGKRFNYETEIISFGAGLNYAMLNFDIAFTITSLVSDVDFNPSFSLVYSLKGK
jgi:hypothetical protein